MPFWSRTRRPRTNVPELAPLVHAWSLSKRHHVWSPRASDKEISRAEDLLGRRLPTTLRAVYEMRNGLGLVGGNLNFLPLEFPDEGGLSLIDLSSKLREWNWKVPEELLIFGDDGGDSEFGLWLPRRGATVDDCPVIELCETEAMAIAGTGLCNFLKGRTAFYLLAEEAPAKSLDALGLPVELRTDVLYDDDFSRIIQWADPTIPDPLPDPFERGVTVEELRSRFNSPEPPRVGG